MHYSYITLFAVSVEAFGIDSSARGTSNQENATKLAPHILCEDWVELISGETILGLCGPLLVRPILVETDIVGIDPRRRLSASAYV